MLPNLYHPSCIQGNWGKKGGKSKECTFSTFEENYIHLVFDMIWRLGRRFKSLLLFRFTLGLEIMYTGIIQLASRSKKRTRRTLDNMMSSSLGCHATTTISTRVASVAKVWKCCCCWCCCLYDMTSITRLNITPFHPYFTSFFVSFFLCPWWIQRWASLNFLFSSFFLLLPLLLPCLI